MRLIIRLIVLQCGSTRVKQFQVSRKRVNTCTAVVGDFNVVLDVSLDVRRDATSTYNTVGADELASLVSDLNLVDEIRE